MNSFFLLIALNLMPAPAQTALDEAAFSATFKTVFEAAKTYFKSEKVGAGKDITETPFVKAYDCNTKFKDASVSRIVADEEMVCQHQVHYSAGTDKAAATALYKKIEALVIKGLPTNYHQNTTYDSRYYDSQAMVSEYNSEVFAEVAKRPSIKMGVMQIDGTYYVEVLIMENIFRR